MKKLLLLFLAVAGMVNVYADYNAYNTGYLALHYSTDGGSNWGWGTFTDKGANPSDESQKVYEFVLNSSTGLANNQDVINANFDIHFLERIAEKEN